MLPSLPPASGLHPLIVHFPVALLLIAPLLVVLSIVLKKQRIGLAVSALVLMVLGTAAAFVAVSTGNLAGELAERTPQISATLERHESLAETTRTVFALLTVMFVVMFGAPLVRRREWSNGLYVALSTVFLVFYAAGTVTLVNTAHLGGQLVHRYGVLAMLGPDGAAASTAPAPSDRDDDDR
jgi:uncharacterized membrane protein